MLSVVVPVYNEAGSLQPLYTRLKSVLSSIDTGHELIFVDDGSVDNSLAVLRQLRQSDPLVKILSLSRNFGHQVALTAGLDHASGDAIVMMDGDLQHPPELIPELVRKWKEGADVVYTVRQDHNSISWFKRTTSHLFYGVIQRLSKVNIPANSADFRLLNRAAADSLRQIRERARFLRGLVSWIGYKQVAVSYVADPRAAGESKYRLGRMMKLAIDGLISFSSVPLYASTFLGLTVSFFSFVYAGFVMYWKYGTNRTVEGWTTIVILVLFLGGIQLITLGIIGEYLAKMFDELKQRPLYLIKEAGGFKSLD